MNRTRKQLKACARDRLAGRYATIIVAFMLSRVILNCISMLATSFIDPNTVIGTFFNLAVNIIVSAIMAIFIVGQNHILLEYSKSPSPLFVSELWYGFKNCADNTIVVFFLLFIRYFVCCFPFGISFYFYSKNYLNMQLLVVTILTGFIALICSIYISMVYALAYYVVIDKPEEKPAKLLAISKDLMDGHKKELFVITLSFTGLYILVILSFGIGIFWVYPYYKMTKTEFYFDVIHSKN